MRWPSVRDRAVRAMATLVALLGACGPFAVPGAAQSTPTARVLAPPAPVNAANAAVALACQSPIRSAAELPAALREIVPALPADYPHDRLLSLRVVPLPAPAEDAPADPPAALAGYERVGVTGVLYWAPDAGGSTLLHELTHAVQYDLRAADLLRLLARLAADDAVGRFALEDVMGATASLRLVLISSSPLGQQRDVAPALQQALASVGLRPHGLMQRRVDALIHRLATPGFEAVRAELAPTHPRRFGHRIAAEHAAAWSWRDEVRAVAFLELMAYEAERQCLRGHRSRYWTP